MLHYIIRQETPKDHREVENLIREAFWNVYRPGCSEHYVMHVLRDDPDFVKELDFVMEKDGREDLKDRAVFAEAALYYWSKK